MPSVSSPTLSVVFLLSVLFCPSPMLRFVSSPSVPPCLFGDVMSYIFETSRRGKGRVTLIQWWNSQHRVIVFLFEARLFWFEAIWHFGQPQGNSQHQTQHDIWPMLEKQDDATHQPFLRVSLPIPWSSLWILTSSLERFESLASFLFEPMHIFLCLSSPLCALPYLSQSLALCSQISPVLSLRKTWEVLCSQHLVIVFCVLFQLPACLSVCL